MSEYTLIALCILGRLRRIVYIFLALEQIKQKYKSEKLLEWLISEYTAIYWIYLWYILVK